VEVGDRTGCAGWDVNFFVHFSEQDCWGTFAHFGCLVAEGGVGGFDSGV
jgi:hypothetical protein